MGPSCVLADKGGLRMHAVFHVVVPPNTNKVNLWLTHRPSAPAFRASNTSPYRPDPISRQTGRNVVFLDNNLAA